MKTATKKQTAQTKAAVPTPPALSAPPVDLSETHEIIIDSVADMLTHGGNPDDVDALIHAAMAHKQRREVSSFAEGSKAAEYVHGFIKRYFDRWKGDLIVAWRKNERSEHPAFQPKTISDRIRINNRDRLEGAFDDFLRSATTEEILLMESILDTWHCGIASTVEGVEEIPLGEAFASKLDGEETYIRLPKGFRAPVQKYINALQAIEDAEGKAAA